MTQSRVRILYICPTLEIGGEEEKLLNLMSHLPVDRWEAQVFCIYSIGAIGREIQTRGYPISVLGRIPGLRDPLALLRLVREIQRIRPHIVHTLLRAANIYGRLAALLARVPVVISTEGNVYPDIKLRYVLAERLLSLGTNAIVAVAESIKEHYVRKVGITPARVEVILNTVNWDRLQTTAPPDAIRPKLGLPANALVAGMISRLTKQKGHMYLLEAIARTPELSSLIVLIIGDGPLRSALEARSLKLGLGPRVKFLGARRDIGDLLSVMDLFVLPSLWEGLPLSLIEAMGAGLPVVATRVFGVPEVVTDDVTGLLVPPADTASLGVAIARLAGDAAARKRLGQAAREFVLPRFNISHYVRELTELYERLLKERAA